MIRTLALIISALIVVLPASAEEIDKSEYLQSSTPYFEKFSYGLSSSSITALLEDSEGFLWLGTQNGVSRFDGIRFHNFFASDTIAIINGNTINALCDDTLSNCIWASYAREPKLVSINKRTYEQRELACQVKDAPDELASTYFWSFVNFNDSLLLASVNYGLCFVNKRTGFVTPLYRSGNTELKSHNNLFSIKVTRDHIYLLANGELYYVASPRDPNLFYTKKMKVGVPKSSLIRRFDVRDDHTLILDCWDSAEHKYSLYEYDTHSQAVRLLVDDHPIVRDIVCCTDGVWMASSAGLRFYSFVFKREYHYTTSNSTLTDNKLQCMIRSHHQPIVWIGSSDGLIKNDYFASKFHITDTRRMSESSSCDLYAIHKDKNGNYWAWFIDGLFKSNDSQGDPYLRKVDDDLSDKLGRLMVTNIEEDTLRNLLYFCTNNSFVCHNYKTNRSLQLNDDEHRVKVFFLKNDGVVVGLTDKNILIAYNPDTHERRVLGTSHHQLPVNSIALDGDTMAWIATKKGEIYSFSIPSLTLRLEAKVGSDKERIDNLRFCYRNGEKELWFSTPRHGLFYFQPKYGKVTRIAYSRMLDAGISCIEVDPQDNVWVATYYGIVCINNSRGAIYEYSRDTYVMPQSFNRNTSCIGPNGEVIMGGANSFVEFDSNNFSINKYYPKPIISSYRYTNATTYNYDAFTEQEFFDARDTIRVPPGIRSLMLVVRSLNYSKSRRNAVQWRMPDVSDQWVTSSTAEPISFTRLSHGENRLELRSLTQEGVPCDEITSVIIDKDVYFYEMPFFQVLCVVAGLTLFALFFIVKIQTERRRKDKLEKEVEKQAGDIRRANVVLTENKTLIERQNVELRRHRDNLEKIVEERTADLVVARERAEESDRLKSAFLANLSHEVRTPMNCIVGFAKLLADPELPAEDRVEFVHLIQESANSLLTLLGDLLDVSRIETGQLRVNMRPVEVWGEFEDVYRLLELEKVNGALDFSLHLDESVRSVVMLTDKDRFRQIIINLVYNAFKFTEKGHVEIRAMAGDSSFGQGFRMPEWIKPPTDVPSLFVSVSDTGIGMPDDKLDVIFEPFRKLENNKTLYPGLGLGLNIVKNLILVLGGQIWVESKLGLGTMFAFYLPIRTDEPTQKK